MNIKVLAQNRSFLIISAAAVILLSAIVFLPQPVLAKSIQFPSINIGIDNIDDSSRLSTGLQILFVLTVLSLAPAILIMMTSFARIVIVLSFLRQALGTQQMPPNQILIGLALFLTFFIMTPVWKNINANALKPYIAKQIGQTKALKAAEKPLRAFMLNQTREKDLSIFADISKIKNPKNASDIPTGVLIPAFIISELKTAFQIGFLIYIPFLILDMVVASVLMSMGMMMLPPIVISMPFKLMLFVMVDGWSLIVGSLVKSFL